MTVTSDGTFVAEIPGTPAQLDEVERNLRQELSLLGVVGT